MFIALLTGVCYRGIEVSARLQQVLLAIEVGTLAVFAVVALVKAGTGHALPGAAHPSLGWLSPWTGSFGRLSNSFLLAVFIYWGWDCALSVNEETKDSARTPGRAAVMATLMLVAIFAVISAAALAYAGPAFLAAHSTDVLGAMATSVLGSTPGKLLVLCVLTSTAASTQTTIMPTARAVLAMSAHGAIPAWFARMHPRYRTPTTATLVMGVVSAAVLRAADLGVEERAGRLRGVGRAADRLLLRADRVRLRLVLPARAADQRARARWSRGSCR